MSSGFFLGFDGFYVYFAINNVMMKTVTVEIKNDIALTFLHNLERLDVLRVIEDKTTRNNQRPSNRFAGCISKERVEELHKELSQMRNEWERHTY